LEFENPYRSDSQRARREILCPEYRRLAREAAQKSIVLLKNDGVLPLRRGMRLGVWGELAASRKDMLGAWAIGADGEKCVSLLDSLNAQEIDLVLLDDGFQESILSDCDAVIAAIGEEKELSGEAASRADISLSRKKL